MRIVAMLTLSLLIAAVPARAQTPDDTSHSEHRVWKILIGTGAVVAGTAVAAQSSKSTKTSGALGVSETSEFSKSQLITGLVVAGTGGFLLWDGIHESRTRPSSGIAFGFGRKAAQLFWRKVW
jgi:hypothetical protein